VQRLSPGSPPSPATRPRRSVVVRAVLALVALLIALPPGAVWADAAGPTDYQSQIVSIDPPTPQLHASIIGGDAFLLLRVDSGTSVEVYGYRSEPFIRFLADGTVQENRASASYFVSRSRLGSALPSDFADDATPEWHNVATDGEYAWHDHRTHWMTDTRPPGKRPGDVVLRQVVPMLVDGVAVAITVQSVWMPAPSAVPVWLGGAAGVAAGLFIAIRVRRRRPVAATFAVPMLGLAALATVVGIWQYGTFPAETGPQLGWFGLPAVAALAAAGVVTMHRRTASNRLTTNALLLLAGVNLVLWSWMRRDGLSKAVLPTNAPAWLDRFASSAALGCGLLAAVFGLAALFRAILSPQSARRITSPAT
jgi:hypothetical protein